LPEKLKKSFDWRNGNTPATDDDVLIHPFKAAEIYLSERLGHLFSEDAQNETDAGNSIVI